MQMLTRDCLVIGKHFIGYFFGCFNLISRDDKWMATLFRWIRISILLRLPCCRGACLLPEIIICLALLMEPRLAAIKTATIIRLIEINRL